MENGTEQKEKISVFVTYCWDEGMEHHKTVTSFTDMLRKKGFYAEMDRLKTQQVTAIDFLSMMKDSIKEAQKVIVVLSKAYKRKADANLDGVGVEYAIILDDIDVNKDKYILVSFEPESDDIKPAELKHRQVIEITNETKDSALKSLFSKLLFKPLINFSPVGKELPVVEAIEIPSLDSLLAGKKTTASSEPVQPINKIYDSFLDEFPNYHHWICKIKLEDQSVDAEALSDAYRKIVNRHYTEPGKMIEVFDEALSHKVGLHDIYYGITIQRDVTKLIKKRTKHHPEKVATIHKNHSLRISKSCIQHEILTYYKGTYYNNLIEEIRGLIILLYFFESIAKAPMHLTLQISIKVSNKAMLNTTGSLFNERPSETVYELHNDQFELHKTITDLDHETMIIIMQNLLRQFHTRKPSIEDPAYVRMDLAYFKQQLQDLKKWVVEKGVQ